MLFNTIDFVIFFITALTVFTLIRNRKFQHVFLLLASYFFFYYSSNYLILLLLYTTIWDYYFGKAIWKEQNQSTKKLYLIISLIGNLGLLGFFKYADFAIAQFNFFGNYFDLGNEIPLLHLVLPIGISFYTFHSITYTVGIYRGQISPAKSFIDYAIFVSFFPQLVAGPILRAKDFLPQLREKIENSSISLFKQIVIRKSELKLGITIMALGFFKKMFFADNIATFVNSIFYYPIGLDSFTIILATIAFGIQIYCDFSGYTDIALGAAIILGFKIPINFNKPYFATSPSDFWRRWHISLSTWLRDYLYVPLGGNRKSKSRTYMNLLIVMFLGGLWHGASWNFVIWGMMHGLFLSIHKLLKDRFPKLSDNDFFRSKIGMVMSVLVTQYLVFLTWIAFRVHDFEYMTYSMQKYLIWDFQLTNTLDVIQVHKFPILLIGLFFILHFISYKKRNIVERISSYSSIKWIFVMIIIMSSIFFFFDGNSKDFIYFQF